MARDTSKWLLEWEPQVRPHASQSATRTELAIVQKCGSAGRMSTAPVRTGVTDWRQSVAIMFVAVRRPVARRNSTAISAGVPSSTHGSSA